MFPQSLRTYVMHHSSLILSPRLIKPQNIPTNINYKVLIIYVIECSLIASNYHKQKLQL